MMTPVEARRASLVRQLDEAKARLANAQMMLERAGTGEFMKSRRWNNWTEDNEQVSRAIGELSRERWAQWVRDAQSEVKEAELNLAEFERALVWLHKGR